MRFAHPRRALTASGLAVAAALAVAACGVPEQSDVRPLDRVPFGLNLTTTTTSTTSTIAAATTVAPVLATTTLPRPPSTVATEAVNLYFVSADQLNEVRVPLASPTSLNQVLAALIGGPPNDATGTGLRTALTGESPLHVRDDGTGVATVDLPETFFDGMTTTDHRMAIGQIVLTLVGRPGIGQVRFTRLGRTIEVPLGTGALAPAGRLLSRRDFLVLLDPLGDPGTGRTTSTTSTTSTTNTTSTTSTTNSTRPAAAARATTTRAASPTTTLPAGTGSWSGL